ncbi:MAG: hypothetical protein HKN92_10920 [Chitinophagales bacterium]|nr:hypothetical protein [Chitinophagales bacterium]
MSLEHGKHIVKELEGVRCTVVESATSMDRVNFLKALLELNGFEVKFAADVVKVKEGEEPPPTTYTVGVTDIVFNPVIAVYQRILRTPDGKHVTPDYWNQLTDELEPNYWDLKKKDFS